MSSEDDAPDFSYAFASALSWNPAFRPDHLSPTKPSFSEREVAPPPTSNGEQSQEHDGGDDDELPTYNPAPPASHPPAFKSAPHLIPAEPTSDDDFFDRYGGPEEAQMGELDAPAHQLANIPQPQHDNVHEAWADIRQEPAASEQPDQGASIYTEQEKEQELPAAETVGSYFPHQDAVPVAGEENKKEESEAHALDRPEGSYDYQGEETTLDLALQEDPEASLVDNAATPGGVYSPAVGWGPGGDDWDIGGTEQVPLHPISEIEQPVQSLLHDPAPETVALAETIPQPEPAPPVQEAELDWEQTEDVDFNFGADTNTDFLAEIASQETGAPQHQHSAQDMILPPREEPQLLPEKPAEVEVDWGTSEDVDFSFGAASQPTGDSAKEIASQDAGASHGSGEEDLSAIWGAELADDDLLLDEDAAAAFTFDDDDGFLEDFPGLETGGLASLDTTLSKPGHERKASIKYTPAEALEALEKPVPTTSSNPYLPQGPNFTDLSPKQPTSNQNFTSMASPYQAPYQPPQPRRPSLSSGESFADKAKGGYSSPYDLPEDLNVSRRRPAHRPAPPSQIQQLAQPPPRLSSMKSSPALRGPPRSQPPSASYSARSSFTPPSSSHGVQPSNGSLSTTSPTETAKAPKRMVSGFFEDLPVTQRPVRHGTPGRYTPLQTGVPTPPIGPTQPPMNRPASYSVPSQAQQSAAVPGPQLQAPARLLPYADDPSLINRNPPTPEQPLATSRYSPAVPPSAGGRRGLSAPASAPAPMSAPPPGKSRYSPAPTAQPQAPAAQPRHHTQPTAAPSRPVSQQYAPRTSSPLAYHTMPQEQQQNYHMTSPTSADLTSNPSDGSPYGRPSFDRIVSLGSQQPLLETLEENEPYGTVKPLPQAVNAAGRTGTPPPAPRSGPPSSVSSPRKRANYAPHQPMVPPTETAFVPPRRSQTSSPGAAIRNPRLHMSNYDPPRPASAHGSVSPKLATAQSHLARAQTVPRQLDYEESNLIVPQVEEHVNDPLQRWRGAPIFKFGISGSIVSSFPKYVPRYGAGHMGPMIKPTQDIVRITTIAEIHPPTDIIAKFPGPLKKGKKKEVLAWLKTTTENMHHANQHLLMNGMVPPPVHKQREEKLLLWKVMSLMVENDGALEGNPTVEEEVRKLISPNMTGEITTAEAFGATQKPGVNAQAEAFDPAALNTLRNQLYKGEREKAVWHAADQRMWAHALLIASTLNNKDLWKQVVQEFVRKEIRKIGDNTEALAALYQVFAGNWEESIDELVSVSARAGFEMVSTAQSGSTQKDALAGLDRWRETLLLILNNRSAGDAQALVALGKLLSGYNRIEAAHVCFLFARNAAIFAGADDPQAHFTLVGGSAAIQGADFGSDLDSILLSEVYEFSFTLGPAQVPSIPHLQAYKLYHAIVLAEIGKRPEAQQYCDSIAAIITSKSNRSPYYNKQLMGWVDELNNRLSQAPLDSSSSWKPSMDKVSTSLWGRFNTFIAGEDSDASNGSATAPAPEPGQFARLAGGTPPISRVVSSADMYGSYQSNGSPVPAASSSSRYAPGNNAHAPRSSTEQQRPRYEPQSNSAYQPRTSGESTRSAYEPRQPLETGLLSSPQSAPNFNNGYTPNSAYSTSTPTLQPAPVIHSPQSSEANVTSSPYAQPSYQPTPPSEQALPSPSYQPTPSVEQHQQQHTNGYQPSTPQTSSSFDALPEPQNAGYEPQPSGYEPPSSGYEPPSYQPYEPEENIFDGEESPAEEKKPKKKSFMDDDDDDEIFRKAAELKAQHKGKSEADKAADEAFRKAAEADAQKDKPPGPQQRGSWFSMPSIFGKKDPNAPQTGPIKAKLGEESSFVYDETAKRWVNKKAGAVDTPLTTATPPPPRSSAPSRASGAMGPPPGRSESPAMTPPIGPMGGLTPGMPPMARSASTPMPPPGSAGGLASRPPSRPTTSMSNASDLDELMGPAQPRGARGKKAPRKGRYVDVMANQK